MHPPGDLSLKHPRKHLHTVSEEIASGVSMSGHSGAGSDGAGTAGRHKLTCSLEELYEGSIRKVKFTRTIVDPNGNITTKEIRLKIKVIPGWTQDTIITLLGLGNVEPRKAPADVVFQVEEEPHEMFTREGHDLIMTKKIPLVEALTDCKFLVRTLDGRRLRINFPTVIPPDFEMAIPGEGMPVPHSVPARSGSLRIKFDVHFPRRLSPYQKSGLRQLLQGCSSSSS